MIKKYIYLYDDECISLNTTQSMKFDFLFYQNIQYNLVLYGCYRSLNTCARLCPTHREVSVLEAVVVLDATTGSGDHLHWGTSFCWELLLALGGDLLLVGDL